MESDKTNSDGISQAELDQSKDNFHELLLTLPKSEMVHPFSTMYQYQGFWYVSSMLHGIVFLQKSFRALPTNIFIAGGFKSGNTWLKSVCFSIATRHQFPDINSSPLLHHVSHDLVPFMELDLAMNPAGGRHPDHPLLSTHLSYTSLPESVRSSACKIVYICREPKDVFVSQCHFAAKALAAVTCDVSITEADVDLFCQGISLCGPYWDHVLGYYKAKMDNPDKIMFLKYEELKRDTLFYVKKLAEFIGFSFSGEEERQGSPEKIVKICSFGNLSGLEVNKTGKHRTMVNNIAFFRKGEIGDWKNHLSAEMAEKFDRVTDEKLSGYDFSFGSASTNEKP